MIHEKFVKEVDEVIADRIDVLSTGKCETMQQYGHACGEILGLRRARAVYLEFLKEAQDSDGDPIA